MRATGVKLSPPYRNSAIGATSQEEKQATKEKETEAEEEEEEEEEVRRRRRGRISVGISEKERKKKVRRVHDETHRNPNRVMSTSLFLDGSREPSSTDLMHEHRRHRQASHKISRGTGHQADRWCVQTVPSREGSEWIPGGGKEGRWRRPSRRATPVLEFLRRKDRAREEERAFSRAFRDATGDVRLRFPRRRRGIAPSFLSFCLPGLLSFLREESRRSESPDCLPPAKLWVRETGRRRGRRRSRRRRGSKR